MRTVPPAVAKLIRPMPVGFNPAVQDRGRYFWWGERFDVSGTMVEVELGFSKAGGKADVPAEMARLKRGAWQLTELARLGRKDLMLYAEIGRHRNRVNSPVKMH